MNKFDEAVNSLKEGIKIYVDKAIENIKADKTYTAIVTGIYSSDDNTYNIKLNGQEYNNIKTKGGTYSINDTVNVKVPLGNFNNMYIESLENIQNQINDVSNISSNNTVSINSINNSLTDINQSITSTNNNLNVLNIDFNNKFNNSYFSSSDNVYTWANSASNGSIKFQVMGNIPSNSPSNNEGFYILLVDLGGSRRQIIFKSYLTTEVDTCGIFNGNLMMSWTKIIN